MEKLFAIIDVETTGGSAQRNKITEIAIVLHNGTEVVDTFETLLNPECMIPGGITELTGISNDMVASAPKFFEVAKHIVKMTEGAVFVAHNVRFDYSFVQEEFRRLGFTFVRKQLCTVKLARKAFPGYPSYSLSYLIPAMRLAAGERHRAMGDTMATVDLFERILASGNTDEQILEIVDMGIREAMLPKGYTLDQLHALPEACGVYYFHDESGNVVYVGKSLNIKKRVVEHFKDRSQKGGKLQRLVADVSYEVTGSELVALLQESHEIKRLLPTINRAQKNRDYPYVIFAFENQSGYRCFDVTKPTVKNRKKLEVVAEYPQAAHAKSWLKGLKDRFQLCSKHCHLEAPTGPCFDFHLHKCLGACIGQESPELYNERADAALQAIDERFADPNFFILDKGKTEGETAVVMVKDGEFRGYGYAEVSELSGNVEELYHVVSRKENNPEVKRIIRRFLDEKKGLKIIRY